LDIHLEMLVGDDLLEMLEDNVLIGSIDHDSHSLRVLEVGGNCVVDDSSAFVQEHGQVALSDAVCALAGSVADCGALQQLEAVGAGDDELSHVADVEDGGAGPAVEVLLDDALGVVDWQIVT
jgi:hypothetical protein